MRIQCMFSKCNSIHEAMLLAYEKLVKIIEVKHLTEVSNSKDIRKIWDSLCLDFHSLSGGVTKFLDQVDKIYNESKSKYDFLVAFLWFYDKERLFVRSNDKYRYKNAVFPDVDSGSEIEEGIQIGYYFILPVIFSEIKSSLIKNYEKIVEKTVHEKSIINRFLKNYSIVENINNKISLKTVEMHEFVKRIKSYGLKVTLNPIAFKNFEYYFDINYHTNPSPSFSVKVVDDHEEELIGVFYESLKKSVLKTPDLILFPEMHLTTKLLDQIPDMIRSLSIERQSLIMVGTLSNETSNTAYLFDNYGNLVLKQKKYGQLLFKDSKNPDVSYAERREWDDKKDVLLSLLDIVDYGRLSIFICKDLFESTKKETLINCSVDYLLMPSYSESNSISDYLKDLTRSRVISVFVNSYNALLKKDDSEKILGKVTLPNWDSKQRFLEYVLTPNNKSIKDDNLTVDLVI